MQRQVMPGRVSLFRSIKLVAWSFLGIRSSRGYKEDLNQVNPLHVVLVGIVAALIVVLLLIALARWAVVA